MSGFIRGWLLPLLFLVLAFVLWQAGDRVDADGPAPTAFSYDATPVTPAFSARRLPATLAWPSVRDDLLIYGDEAIAASPDTSCVAYRADGRSVFEANGDLAVLPASNQKIVTTWAAIKILGPDTRFTTRVFAAVPPDEEGVVDGNLYLVGGGDPFLSTAAWRDQFAERSARYSTALEDLADAVVAAGINQVTGNIVADESLLDSERSGPWAERLVEQRQSGPLSAVGVNEGFVNWPATFVSVGSRTPTDDPPTHSASVFAEVLGAAGVTVEGSGEGGTVPENSVEVATVQSPTVTEMATHVNSYSNNFGAEILLKQIGLARGGAGSTAAGAAAVKDLLESEGLWRDDLSINDGSGLSEQDRLTCNFVLDVLEAGQPEDFAQTMAIGAERGSLFTRYEGTAAAGHVLAKTGTLRDVSALSGYAESVKDPEETVVFSYIANDAFEGLSGPEVQDTLVEGLVTFPSGADIDALAPEPAVQNG